MSEFRDAAHRQSYITALEAEITRLEQRIAQVVDDAPFAAQLKAEAEDGIKTAKAELARVKKTKAPKDEETATADEPAAE